MVASAAQMFMAKIITLDDETRKKGGTADCSYLFCMCLTPRDQQWPDVGWISQSPVSSAEYRLKVLTTLEHNRWMCGVPEGLQLLAHKPPTPDHTSACTVGKRQVVE
jgi:hypothetical protein